MRPVFISWGGNRLELLVGETLVGRDPTCRLRLQDASISRKHARFWTNDGVIVLVDLASRNGTFVNGERIEGPRIIEIGDRIAIGDLQMSLTRMNDDFETEVITGESVLIPKSAAASADEFPDVTVNIALGTRDLPRGEDRRHPRNAVTLPIVYDSDNLHVEAVSLNLSRSGVFIHTTILDTVGTRCHLTLLINNRELSVEGMVRRVVAVEHVDQPTGLGIEFLEVGAAGNDLDLFS